MDDESTQPSNDLTGRTLGDYRVVSRIGRGGMGVVYEATQISMERLVAVKVLTPDLSQDQQVKDRFVREARVLAKLRHDHVLQAYDHGIAPDGRLYLVTELLSGQALNHLLASRPGRRLPIPVGVRLLGQIAQALEAVHAKGIVHRDLKPHNVFVEPDEAGSKAKLLDFGIARPFSGSGLTVAGMIGTPAYMSPEQIQQDPKVDGRSDLYSLGVRAFEIFAGHTPCAGERQ